MPARALSSICSPNRPSSSGTTYNLVRYSETIHRSTTADGYVGTDEIGIHKCSIPSCQRFFLVDTPGFDDSFRSDADILRQLSEYLAAAWSRKMQLTGLLYLHRIMDVRFGGAAGRNLRMFRKLCGDDNLASVVLATTFWKQPITQSEVQREEQLKTNFWAPLISKGSRVVRQDRDLQSGIEIIESIINRRERVTLSIQHELVDEGKTVAETVAGEEVLAEMAELKKRHENEITQLRADIKEAIEERDEYWLEELKKAKKAEEEKIARDERAAKSLTQAFGQLYNVVEGEVCSVMPYQVQKQFNKELDKETYKKQKEEKCSVM